MTLRLKINIFAKKQTVFVAFVLGSTIGLDLAAKIDEVASGRVQEGAQAGGRRACDHTQKDDFGSHMSKPF